MFANDFAELNLGRLQKAIDDKKLDASAKIDGAALRKAGIVHKSRDGVRLLGKGEFTAKLEIEVAGASASAKEAIEKAGGTLTTTFKKGQLHEQEGPAGQAQGPAGAAAAEKRGGAQRQRLIV
ncbi:MAG: uL15m family ribosomal protein [Rhizomicrobium sp.]